MTGNKTIRTRLMLSFMVTMWVALLLATGAFVGGEVMRARSTMVSNVAVLADVIGLSSTEGGLARLDTSG